MNDTKKTLSDLELLYSDNDSGEIGAQDLRDGFKSTFGSHTVSSYDTDFSLTRDEIFVTVNTSAGEVSAFLPTISASDGSGDTFRNKFYYFNNDGDNQLKLVAGSYDTISDSTYLTVNPSETISVIAVSGENSSWKLTGKDSTYSTPTTLETFPIGLSNKNISVLDDAYFTTIYVGDSNFKINTIQIHTISTAITSAEKEFFVGIYPFEPNDSADVISKNNFTITHSANEVSKTTSVYISDVYLNSNTMYYIAVNGGSGSSDIKLKFLESAITSDSVDTNFKLSSYVGLPSVLFQKDVSTGRELSNNTPWCNLVNTPGITVEDGIVIVESFGKILESFGNTIIT